ncbi:hypothetical protein GOP47_0013845 [Adiantum capillus-veneris]|uniref:SHSP domain-containing protein n=1 Tax=Adiantum capillus-veneris TaxID=13818 RepID=A0A9D4UPT2_ADICA|nr:hypothetical protein GOP47_0013845 [Adiantum capillus-veneris]
MQQGQQKQVVRVIPISCATSGVNNNIVNGEAAVKSAPGMNMSKKAPLSVEMHETIEGLEVTASLAGLGMAPEIEVQIRGRAVSVSAKGSAGGPSRFAAWELPKSVSAEQAVASLDRSSNLLLITFPRTPLSKALQPAPQYYSYAPAAPIYTKRTSYSTPQQSLITPQNNYYYY